MKFARVIDETEDWWQTISPAERQSIEEGLADVEEGQTVSHEQIKKQYEHWLQNPSKVIVKKATRKCE